MAVNFAEIAFTDAVKEMQEKNGSRKAYERMEKLNIVDGLSVNEIEFIRKQDSFFMASFGASDFPYPASWRTKRFSEGAGFEKNSFYRFYGQ